MLILTNCLIVSYTIVEKSYLYTNIFLILLIILQIILLIRYLNQSNKFLENFLIYLKDQNTTLDISGSLKNSPFNELSDYFNDINTLIQDAKIEKENHFQFLQYIFEHVNVGLIAYDHNLKVIMANNAVKNLLNIDSLFNLRLLNPKLFKAVQDLKTNEVKTTPVLIGDKNLQLSIKLSKFKLLEQEISLISLHDIKKELDHKEIESWQKLNRVLTHEIMNSVSPIIGLTNNVSKLLKKDKDVIPIDELNQEKINQTIQSINIIEERSLGLEHFVKKFRSVTTNITPEPSNIIILELFEDLSILLHESFKTNSISFTYEVYPEELELFADKNLIEQVIINLVKNAIEALEETKIKTIKLHAFQKEDKQIIIEIIDNGKGIDYENIDLIFTPFYTTKEKGSGIGLSLAKNILNQQGFNIDVWSEPNQKTVFTLYF